MLDDIPWVMGYKFVYQDLSEAPVGHREVAQLVVAGYANDEIALATGYASETVQLIRNHPPVAQHINELQLRMRMEDIQDADSLRGIFRRSLERMKEAIEDPTLEINAVQKIAEFAADRSPDAKFAKTRKEKGLNVSVLVTGDTLRSIRENAKRYELESRNVVEGRVVGG